MRRKNLIFTVTVILILVILHGRGFSLKESAAAEKIHENREQTYRLEGIITDVESASGGGFQLKLKLQSIDGAALKRRGECILVKYDAELQEPWELYLRKVSFSGTLKVPEGRRNPGCFDYNLYLRSQNIFFQSTAENLTYVKQDTHLWTGIMRWLIQQRMCFMDYLGDTSKGMVSGILFGDTSMLEDSVYEEFRNNGTAHILAVSGLHVGILYALYKKVFGNRQTVLSVLFLLILLFGYGTISMWSASMCRAAMMICLHEMAQMLDLRYDMTTGLCTTALFFLFRNPYCIFSTGFQMSFLAIASICFLTRILPKKVPDGMAAGLAVNLGLALYQIYQFNYISFVSILVNFPVIFLTGILVPAAMLCFCVFVMSGELPPVLEYLMDSLSFFTVQVNHISALGGYGSMDAASPPLWVMLFVYFLLFFLSSEQNLVLRSRRQYGRLAAALAAGLLCCVLFSTLYYCPVSDADLVFVDVGQGDCIHIRRGSQNILMDGGGSINYNIGKNTLKPYLLKNGVWNVDLALATHTHMDHYKGLEELAEVYPVKEIRTGLTAGVNVSVSEEVWIETLWPLKIDPEKGQEENEACSVFMIHYGQWKILVTGDLDEAGELAMVDYYEAAGQQEKLDADILKIGHHGSRTSTCDRFLDAVSPEAAVIQVGKNNTYGHPSQIIVEKCQKRDIIIIRNDYNGGIGFSFQDDHFRIDTVL